MAELESFASEAEAAEWLSGRGLEPTIRPTRFEVSLLPEDRHYTLLVEALGDRWAVTHFGRCLGADGAWADGVLEYGRGDAWLASHRFDRETALRLAVEAAPGVAVNGITAAEALARREAA